MALRPRRLGRALLFCRQIDDRSRAQRVQMFEIERHRAGLCHCCLYHHLAHPGLRGWNLIQSMEYAMNFKVV